MTPAAAARLDVCKEDKSVNREPSLRSKLEARITRGQVDGDNTQRGFNFLPAFSGYNWDAQQRARNQGNVGAVRERLGNNSV
jgi:hypothetical protein